MDRLFFDAAGGLILWAVVEPLEHELQMVAADPAKAAPLVRSVGLSHLVATGVIAVGLLLLSRKPSKNGTPTVAATPPSVPRSTVLRGILAIRGPPLLSFG